MARLRASAAVVLVVPLLALAGACSAGGAGRAGGSPPQPPAAASTPLPTEAAPATPATPAAPATATVQGAPGGPVPRGFAAASATFVSTLQAYVLGDAPCPRAPCTSVVRTLDGGRSWRGVPAPRAILRTGPAGGRDTVRELRFATGQDGYAYGGALWTTHDGARTWRRASLPAFVLDLATDGRTVYAVVADCPSGTASCRDLRLLTSPVTIDAFRPAPVQVPPAAGAAAGMVSTGGGTTVATLHGATYVRRGTGPWTRVTTPCQPLPGWAVAPASGSTLVAFCTEGAAGSSYLTVQQSADGGRHWAPVRGQPVRHLNEGLTHLSTTAGSAQVLAIAWADSPYGGDLQVSRDGGRTWSSAPLPRTRYGWRYAGARSATALVALADPPAATLWTSDTAGLTWTGHPIR